MHNIETPVPVDIYFTDKGKMRIIRLQEHALPEFISRDKAGNYRVDQSFAERGYGHLRTAYDNELADPKLEPKRRANLVAGRDWIFGTYLKAYIDGTPVDTSINPPDDPAERASSKYIPDELLPKAVLERRTVAGGGRVKLELPTVQSDDKGKPSK